MTLENDPIVQINRLTTDAARLHAKASRLLREAERKSALAHLLQAQQPGYVPGHRRRCEKGGGGECKAWGVALAHGLYLCEEHAKQMIAAHAEPSLFE